MRVVLIALAAFICCGCAVNKQLTATGGSRADGTVTLSYEVAAVQKPVIDFEQGLETARSRCRAWGYPNAEKFGGETRQCQYATAYGCSEWFVSLTYQCLGGKTPT